MQTLISETRLPNGMNIFCLRETEVPTLYEQIQEYFKNGVSENNIQQIDLLKVDVEKSELEVFLGIKEQDWSKIKQVVLEIHDLDGRVEKIATLLKAHGLTTITVEQEPLFKGSNIFNMYALRKS